LEGAVEVILGVFFWLWNVLLQIYLAIAIYIAYYTNRI